MDEEISGHHELLVQCADVRAVEELKNEGAADMTSWPDLQQGYAGKLLHTVVHLLDGFFGIDSVFYNLIENSHQVSPRLLERTHRKPGNYYLVEVLGLSASGHPDRVPMLRPFGREIS